MDLSQFLPSLIIDPRVATVLLVAARVSALVAVAPGLSLRIVPLRIRALLTLLLTTAAVGSLTEPVSVKSSMLPELLLHQAVVGASLGLVPAVMIWGVQLASSTSQGLTGLPGFGVQDPSGDSAFNGSAAERFLVVTTLAVFFAAGGHRQLIQAVLLSFHWLGPAAYVPLESTRELVIGVFAQSFALGVRSLSPIIASLTMSLLALACVNRILPQVGYFAMGMSVQVLVLLGSLMVFLGSVVWLWDGDLPLATERLQTAWQQLLSH